MITNVTGLWRLQLSRFSFGIDPWYNFIEAVEDLREIEAKDVPYLF